MISPVDPTERHVGSEPSLDRSRMRNRLTQQVFDVLVVGGGITGLGVAVDAASRGLSTALLERHDFASGTSSKSSKLVHGGLRYLQQGDVRLVYEALHERRRLMRNARHLVDVLPFMIPILTKDGLVSRKIARALGSALWMYDLTGGLRIGRVHRRLRKKRAVSHFPTIDPTRLASAYVYYDAQADDARLCIALALTAADHGASVLNHAEVTDITRDSVNTRSAGDTRDVGAVPMYTVTVHDTEGSFTVRARSVVNAAGVWVDTVLSRVRSGVDGDPASFGTIRPAKGVHITVPWEKVRNDIAVVIPVPKDRRSLFLVPWGRRPDGTFTHTYVGTTDTDYSGSRDDPQCTQDDIDYIIRALNHTLTTNISRDDIVGTWAGLRPLVIPPVSHDQNAADVRTADLSRRHKVSVIDGTLVTVTGGKLTTYREMAEDAVDALAPALGLSIGRFSRHRCRTKTLALHDSPARRIVRRGDPLHQHLWSRHGLSTRSLLEEIAADPRLGEPIVDGLPYVRAEIVHAVRHEMACTVDDVLSRRTRALLFDRDGSRAAAPATAELMGSLLGWDEGRISREVRAYHEICDHEAVCASLSNDDFDSSDSDQTS